MTSLVWNLKRNDTNELTKQERLTVLENELVVAGERGRRDSQGVWDGHVDIAMFKMDKQQGPLCIA